MVFSAVAQNSTRVFRVISDSAIKLEKFKGGVVHDLSRSMDIASNDVPVVTWTPNHNTNGEVRVYSVWGKTNLTDAAWICPTNSDHRLFKV